MTSTADAGLCKTGAEHLKSLRDGRAVYIDGALVADVTEHGAFRNAVHSAAALYDFQARPENIEKMTFLPPGGGRRVNRCWQVPKSYDELVARRRALTAWAEQSAGFVGRSPDHVASSLLGQVIGIDVFRRYDEKRAKALLDYYDYASRNDLFLSYVIINPQADRAKAWGEQQEELVAQLVDEDASGITVRGAKMLGTSAIMANEILVASLQPLQPGEEKLALSFVIPLATEMHSTIVGSAFDVSASLPILYDKIFIEMGDAYNKATGGKFGRIKAVRAKDTYSPFTRRMSEYGVPDGFVLPILYGLKALMEVRDGRLQWRGDPTAFLDRHMKALVGAFKMPMEMAGFDPQRIAKSENSYLFMVGEVEKALLKEQAAEAAE